MKSVPGRQKHRMKVPSYVLKQFVSLFHMLPHLPGQALESFL